MTSSSHRTCQHHEEANSGEKQGCGGPQEGCQDGLLAAALVAAVQAEVVPAVARDRADRAPCVPVPAGEEGQARGAGLGEPVRPGAGQAGVRVLVRAVRALLVAVADEMLGEWSAR